MVGMYTPSGVRVSGRREAPRMRIQGRRKDDGHMRYEATVGTGQVKIPVSDYRPKVAPIV
jgi:hypothetical protein